MPKLRRCSSAQKACRARTHQQTRCRQSRGQLRNDNVQSTVQQPDPPLRARTCLQTSRQLTTSTFQTTPQPASQQRSQSSLSAPSGDSPGPSTSDTVQQIRGQHCSHGSTFRGLNCPPHTFYNTTNIGTLSVTCTYCKALKFSKKPTGLCCSNDKVVATITTLFAMSA